MSRIDSHFDLAGNSPVALAFGDSEYAAAAPYPPGTAYPEYPFGHAIGGRNPAYAGVRTALQALGLDAGRFDTPAWNPLGGIVRPGDTVVIKPNLVREYRETLPGHGDCTITHGSLIRAVADYVCIALGGRGRIVIADAPQDDADFSRLRQAAGLEALQVLYRREAGMQLEVYDLRPQCVRKIDGVIVGHSPLRGDPAGYVQCNLGRHSAFHEINHLCHLLYGSDYDMGELSRHQRGEIHEYLISRTVLEADCVIGLPKLKTHKKAGLTVNLKNMVGINGNKNWLPHHREGTRSQGGDQFAEDTLKRRIERLAVARFKRVFPMLGPLRPLLARPIKSAGRGLFGDTQHGTIRSGNWYGNDTAWRMVLDLNRILVYADASGKLHDHPMRRFASIVDGIIAGERNGPLDATPKPCGLVAAGLNPVAVDAACARVMGFGIERLPILARALAPHPFPLAQFEWPAVRCRSNNPRFDGMLGGFDDAGLAFCPHFGWECLRSTTERGKIVGEQNSRTSWGDGGVNSDRWARMSDAATMHDDDG